MGVIEFILILLGAVAALAAVAGRLGVPYPILFVLGGVAIALVPGLPTIVLPPDVVFIVFFPPLLYSAGYRSSFRDLRANLRPVISLAIGYTFASTVGLAVVAHAVIPALAWPTALVLGTILAPSDAVAAIAVFERLPVPRRAVTILEGESLLNDAVSFTLYRLAVVAVVTGPFSAPIVAGGFILAVVGGVGIGLVVGWLAARVLRRLEDPSVEVLVSLLVPYAAWIPADAVGASGALAVVATGLYVGQTTHLRLEAGARLRGTAFWDVLDFILEGLLFILVGLQLRLLHDVLAASTPATLVAYVAALCLAAIVVRVAWSFGARWLSWVGARLLHLRSGRPLWRIVALIAWSGMRGADSLAPALALPLATAGGSPFPDRDLIIFLTFAVILVTLLLQGLSLPALARWLGLGPEETGREEELARASLARAALARLDELAGQPWVPRDDAKQLRELYAHRAEHASASELEDWLRHRQASQRLRRAALDAERREAVRLRDRGQISDEVLRRIEHRLDLEEQGLAAG